MCAEGSDLYNEWGNLTDSVNIYDIFGTCYGNSNDSSSKWHSGNDFGLKMTGGKIQPYRKAFTTADYTPWMYKNKNKNSKNLKTPKPVIPGCTFASGTIDYLSDDTVRSQLHIPADVQTWALCSEINYTPFPTGSQWIWESLKDHYRFLKFSGDTDGAVPTKGTIRWMEGLGLPVLEEWKPWFYGEKKLLGGYIKRWDGMTLGTVHGAGHMAPQWKPAETYHLVFNWLKQIDI